MNVINTVKILNISNHILHFKLYKNTKWSETEMPTCLMVILQFLICC